MSATTPTSPACSLGVSDPFEPARRPHKPLLGPGPAVCYPGQVLGRLGLVLLISGSGCLLEIDEALIPGRGPGDGGVRPDGGPDGCPADQVPLVSGGCIDRTEVNNQAYRAFVDARGGDLSGRPEACAFDTQNEPSQEWPPSQGRLEHPVTFVDWCDAFAYCSYLGRSLCAAGAWREACGTLAYPYGASYQAGTCQGDAQNPGQRRTDPVGSHPGCVGPSGALDLSGSVEEWINDCAGDQCGLAGGSFLDPPASLTCTAPRTAPIGSSAQARGFRCCSP